MSSTVTTATISTVTTAASADYVSQALTLLVIVVLAAVLLVKEITTHSSNRGFRVLARGLDVGVLPMLTIFGLIVFINLGYAGAAT